MANIFEMKTHCKYIFLVIALLILESCSKDDISMNSATKDSVVTIPKDTSRFNIDWEDSLAGYNEPYRDSILFMSTRERLFVQTIFIIYKDGTGLARKVNMGESFNAKWSPKKWKILYLHYTDPFNSSKPRLYIMNADNSDNHMMPSPSEDVWSFECSPDDKKIAYITADDHGWGPLKLMNVNGSNLHNITDSLDIGFSTTITWSPDSRQIAFDGYASYRIGIVDSTGKNLKELIKYESQCVDPTWSPDGTTIAFVAYNNSINYPPDGDIFLYDVSTKNISKLTSIGAFVNNPTWSPNGQSVVFTLRDSLDKDHLYFINKDGSGLKQLTNDTTHSFIDWRPAWK